MMCAFCRTTNAICFWGPRPEAAWKRPLLALLSLALSSGCGELIWVFHDRRGSLPTLAIAAALMALGVYSLCVSMRGCNACVARLFGEV